MKQFYLTLIASLVALATGAQTPAAITGVSYLCTGGSSTLADASPGGTWTSDNTAIATVGSATGAVAGVASGVTSITYTTGGGYVLKFVTVNISASVFTVTGGGTSCGGTGGDIGLSGSQGGATYQLFRGTSPVGPAIAGTGTIISFGPQTANGVYSVVGSMSTGCSTNMTGTATVTADPAAYSVTGGGSFCTGGAGVHIGLAGSGTGISYRLYNSGIPVGAPLAGTGANLDFGLETGVGNYTVVATNTSTTCTRTMTGSVNVMVNPPPIAYAVTGGGTYCSGSPGVHVGLNGSNPGCSYALFNSGTAVAIVAGTGSMLDFGLQPVGFYTIYGSNTAGCANAMAGSATVDLGTAICSGTPGTGVATASSAAYCTGGADTLHLNGYPNECGISFQWQSSADGSSWTAIGGANTNSYTIHPALPLHYRCGLTCATSGLTAYSNDIYIPVSNGIAYHHVTTPVDTICSPADFYISACGISATFNVTTCYGDGTSDNTPLTTSGVCHAHIYHSYTNPGMYSVKQVLYDGVTALDSASFSYNYYYCNVLAVNFYNDNNNNCIRDSGEQASVVALVTEVDSNGIAIDTISATSGFYYKAHGVAGTVYGFRVLSVAGGLQLSCPSPGIIYDTLQSYISSYPPKYAGITCSTSSGTDLAEYTSMTCGRHMATGTISVSNTRCFPASSVLTMNFSPKYVYFNASPPPSSQSGNTITWDLGLLSLSSSLSVIHFWLNVPTPEDYSSWLIPGDTVQTNVTVGPMTSDVNTSNNVTLKNDTVRSSYDPNEMSVAPEGGVLPCTPLQYTINFENTGNAAAGNIYIMDTLSDNLDPHSLRIVTASALMNIAMLTSGGHNIVKFDFPGINLADSSHHGQCDGMVVFTIKAKAGLADGAAINNYAGIYFDDNPPVATNTVNTIIGMSPIQGPGNVCVGAAIALANNTTGGVWGLTNARASLTAAPPNAIAAKMLTGNAAGPDSVKYTVTNSCVSRSVSKVITVDPLPSAITGGNHICAGTATPLADATPGGRWSSSNAAISAIDSVTGMITGVTTGTDTVAYVLTTGCKTNTVITVNPLPEAYTVTGGGSYCTGGAGAHIGLSNSDSLIHYLLYRGSSPVGSFWPGAGAALDFGALTASGTYSVVATNPATTCSKNMSSTAIISVNPLPAIFTVMGGGSYCAGDTGVHVTLSGSATGVNYQLYNGGTALGSAVSGTGTALDFGLITTAGVYTVSAVNAGTSCTKAMAAVAAVNVNPLPVVYTVTGGGGYCTGGTGVPLYLSGSSTGINYRLYNTGVAGSIVAGSGTVLDFGLHTLTGTYTVTATDPSTTCTKNMSSSVVITTYPLPVAFAVSGGGSHCAGDTGVAITLSGSATGTSYQLYFGGVATGSPLAGSGPAVDFGLHTAAGSYTVRATDTAHACVNNMTGSAVITVVPTVAPVVTIFSDAGDTICQGAPIIFNVTSVNGGTAPTYQWRVNGINTGTGDTYTYVPANSDIVTALLHSNATCALPDTAVSSTSMAIDSSYSPVVTVTASSGTYVNVGERDTFIAVVTGAGPSPYYQWKVNGVPVSGAYAATYVSDAFFNNDSVSCDVKGTGICGSWAGSNKVAVRLHNVSASSINTGNDVGIFPNPNKGIFTIKGSLGSQAANDPVAAVITDVIGQVVFTGNIRSQGGAINEQIDLSQLLSAGAGDGLYMLSLHSASGNRVIPFVIEK